MSRLFRIGMIMSVCLLVFVGLVPAKAADASRFFPESAQNLKGDFLAYWEMNGGLPVFGYPTTSARTEENFDTGDSYATQWFERTRAEYHPENAGTPYTILLGRLGADSLEDAGRDWTQEPQADGPKAGCLWFEETKHNVCNIEGNLGFKTYWETHGLKIPGLDDYARSLQLFGLPLTEPQYELNASGDEVLTQWFERARFEWHPNNPDEYKVLLGLLGNELRNRGTAPRIDCEGIRAPLNGSWDRNCAVFGESLTLTATGFRPNEEVIVYFQDPDFRGSFIFQTVGYVVDDLGTLQVTVNTLEWLGEEMGPGNYQLNVLASMDNDEGNRMTIARFRVIPRP